MPPGAQPPANGWHDQAGARTLVLSTVQLIITFCRGEWLVGLRRFEVRFGAWGEKLNAETRSKDWRRGGDQVWAVISGFRPG